MDKQVLSAWEGVVGMNWRASLTNTSIINAWDGSGKPCQLASEENVSITINNANAIYFNITSGMNMVIIEHTGSHKPLLVTGTSSLNIRCLLRELHFYPSLLMCTSLTPFCHSMNSLPTACTIWWLLSELAKHQPPLSLYGENLYVLHAS